MPLTLKSLEAEKATEEQAVEVPMRDLAGEPYTNAKGEPVTMRVLGQHSAPVRAAQAANLRRLAKQHRAEFTPEMSTENRLRVAVVALVGWGMEDEGGSPLPLNAENIRAVCKVAPWLLDQVESAMLDHARFFTPGSTNS